MSASRPNEPLRLSADDLFSPRVDAFLDEQAMRNRSMPEVEPQPWILRVLYSSYFYLSLASGLGAFVAWMIYEPFVSDANLNDNPLARPAVPDRRRLRGPVPRRRRGHHVPQCAPGDAQRGRRAGRRLPGGPRRDHPRRDHLCDHGEDQRGVLEGPPARPDAHRHRPRDPDDGPGLRLGPGVDPRRHRPGDRFEGVEGRAQRPARRRPGRVARRPDLRPHRHRDPADRRRGLAQPRRRLHA